MSDHIFYDQVNGYYICRTCKCKFLSLYDFITHYQNKGQSMTINYTDRFINRTKESLEKELAALDENAFSFYHRYLEYKRQLEGYIEDNL